MTPVQKALWYIESRFYDDVSLDDIAAAANVTKHYLVRAFNKALGLSVMQYVKARRLSEAAKLLAGGASDIMSVALIAGYKSHEAFTRACGDFFNMSPRQIRELGHVSSLTLQDAILLDDDVFPMQDPRIEQISGFKVTGLMQSYTRESKAGIPSLWHMLDQYLERVGGQLGTRSFGVCYEYSEAGDFNYLCGIEGGSKKLDNFGADSVSIPSHRYAIFPHHGHISGIRGTWSMIYNNWLPASGFGLANAPEYESYSIDFDPVANRGTVDIYIPIERL